ncbi:alpha/beta hydrolase [Pseudolysinimonas sp.]|uniref:alpha/beta hydrolase n=1 Tax=Pseudolysinimonas sp. TaxID=2680009 RepID=UPI00286AF924|nr:alpha/beta hydrolase [Pseudolysinimonas sp.]
MPRFTAARGDYTFEDAEGVTIHYYVWRAANPKAVVQIVHGLGEYSTRYEEPAQALVAAGYTVYAGDLRGHGQTGLEQWAHDLTKLGRLGPGGVRATIAGIRQLSGIAHAEHAKLPLVLLGHSLGSIFAQMMLNDDASLYTAAVLSATPYRTLRHMNGGDLAKRHRLPGGTGTEWLSRDPDVWTRFATDPLTFDAKAAKLFGVVDGMRLLGRPVKLNRDLPLLILIGSEDPLGGPKSVELLAKAYRGRGGLSDVELKIYDEGRHEMFNEINREEVYADLVAWLDTKLAVAARS